MFLIFTVKVEDGIYMVNIKMNKASNILSIKINIKAPVFSNSR